MFCYIGIFYFRFWILDFRFFLLSILLLFYSFLYFFSLFYSLYSIFFFFSYYSLYSILFLLNCNLIFIYFIINCITITKIFQNDFYRFIVKTGIENFFSQYFIFIDKSDIVMTFQCFYNGIKRGIFKY